MKPIKPDVANLSVTTDGRVFWNDERMSDEQLAQRLQASAPRQPQPEGFIRGDRPEDRLCHVAGLPALAWQQQALTISIQCPGCAPACSAGVGEGPAPSGHEALK